MIAEIENERRELAIGQKALCAEAGVHPTTYCRLKRAGGGNSKTLDRLKAALQRIRERQGEVA